MKKAMSRIVKVMRGISMIAITALVAINGYEIFCRFFLKISNYWIQDYSSLLMVWFVFPGMVVVVWEKKDILIDLLPKALSIQKQRILNMVVHGIVIIFSAGMVVSTLSYLRKTFAIKSITARIPMPFFSFGTLIGFMIFLGIYIIDLWEIIKNKDTTGELGGRDV